MVGNSSLYMVEYKDCNNFEWNDFAELSEEDLICNTLEFWKRDLMVKIFLFSYRTNLET